jgi:hypothetical protein
MKRFPLISGPHTGGTLLAVAADSAALGLTLYVIVALELVPEGFTPAAPRRSALQ